MRPRRSLTFTERETDNFGFADNVPERESCPVAAAAGFLAEQSLHQVEHGLHRAPGDRARAERRNGEESDPVHRAGVRGDGAPVRPEPEVGQRDGEVPPSCCMRRRMACLSASMVVPRGPRSRSRQRKSSEAGPGTSR